MCRFPGRRLLEWALILPLAVPAYVIAYTYTEFLQYVGPVQTLLREVTGWNAQDYWFPPIRSRGGAIAMLILVLYPYVYLRSEEHTSELQSLMRISYAVFCLKKKKQKIIQ